MSTSEAKRRASIYYIHCVTSGKGYVGQTVNGVKQRFYDHVYDAKRGSKLLIHKALRKHGKENFQIREIASCDVLLVNDLERHFIALLGTQCPGGYNLSAGGHPMSGWKHSEETRQKMSKAMKGRKQTAEHIAKAAAGKIGRKHSEETRSRMRDAQQRLREKRADK